MEIVLEENRRQSLISTSTEAAIWERHVTDSFQLLRFPAPPGRWVDIGSGAGFPGLVVAIASSRDVTLVEPRRLRAEFLEWAARETQCSKVTVAQCRVEAVRHVRVAVLSARAVAPLTRVFELACHLASEDTCWILPKGRNAAAELETARETWQGEFCVEKSLTDPDAGIVIARNVRRR